MTQAKIDTLAENVLTFTQSAIDVLGSDGRITKFKCPLCGGVAVAGIGEIRCLNQSGAKHTQS